MSDKLFSVAEIALMFGVTCPAVRYWIKQGLATSKEKVIGKKERRVIKIKDVEDHLNIKLSEVEKKDG